jgi:anti-sigma B factor antagonist
VSPDRRFLEDRVTRVFPLPHELVVASRLDVRYQVCEALASGERSIVLDAARTSYIDSSGLGMLVGLHRAAHEAGGRLVIAGATEYVRTLFSVTHFDRVFELASDIEAARALLASAAPAPPTAAHA